MIERALMFVLIAGALVYGASELGQSVSGLLDDVRCKATRAQVCIRKTP